MEKDKFAEGESDDGVTIPDNAEPPDGGGAKLQPGERRQLLLEVYKEVCRSHAGITDFRAKLLAILPIVSGTGVGVLIAQLEGDARVTVALFFPLGIFGFLVTVGLFFYELRQINICKYLRNHAAWIEEQLGIEAGQFGGRPERLSLSELYRPRIRRDKEVRPNEGERDMRSRSQAWSLGLFRRPFIDAEAAGYLIYHTVIAAWLFVAVVGAVGTARLL